MSELQNIWKKKQKKKFENHVCYPLSTWKKQEQFENHVRYPLSTDKYGAAEYYEPWVSACRGLLPYISHMSMCRPKGNGFCDFSVWKQEYWHFAHFGLESGMVFKGNMGVYSGEICEFEMDFKKSLI